MSLRGRVRSAPLFLEIEMNDVMKVMPWSEDQGEYVLIDAKDFDPEFHKEYQPEAATKKKGK